MLATPILRTPLIVALLLIRVEVARAQTPSTCGIVDVEGPSEVEVRTQVVFKAKITGMTNTTRPQLKWTISAGTITAGQGTQEIMVDSTGLDGVDVIATVELFGAPAGCKASASRTTQVKVSAIDCGLAFDQYGDITFEDEKARLDNFAIQLSNQPLSSGQILMSAGQVTFKNETTERLARAKSYLVDVRKTDPNRIVTNDCGFTRDLNIRLYIVPVGVYPAACDNSVEIPLSEIKFTKPRPRSSKRRHKT